MKLIDAVVFWKRKAMIEGSNDQSKNFEMDILDEGALYKALTVTEKTSDLIKPGRQFMMPSVMDNLNNNMFSFQNIFHKNGKKLQFFSFHYY